MMGIEKIWNTGNVIIPDDYTYFDCDVVLTNYVKKHIGERTLFAMQKNSKWGSKTVGYWAPGAVVRAALQYKEATNAERLKKKKRREERDTERFAIQIKREFPGCPDNEVREIAEWTCQIGSRRVGRSETAENPVVAAVVAHIRHHHTDYDDLLACDWELAAARERVRPQIEQVLNLWGLQE